jgi:hypothetical protein
MGIREDLPLPLERAAAARVRCKLRQALAAFEKRPRPGLRVRIKSPDFPAAGEFVEVPVWLAFNPSPN